MRTPRTYPLVILACIGAMAHAQVRSDKPIVLNGSGTNDRQLNGVHDGVASTDAMNARTLQRGTYLYAEVSGTNTWQADLQPAITQVIAGTCLILHVANANTGAVTISVNGSSPYALRKQGALDLSAGDVDAGAMVSVVFDGSAFQLISARRLDRRTCPSGTVQVNALYCIELDQHDSVDFPAAANTCGGQDMHLCTWGEWYIACTQATLLGLNGMTGDWEWVGSAANSDGQARVVGQSVCSQAGATSGWNSVARNFRCCYRR